MQSLFVFILVWVGSFSTLAQTIVFSKKFSNLPMNPESGWSIREVSDGYLLFSATGCVGNINDVCTVLAKLDVSGNVVWFKQYPFYPGGIHSLEVFQDSIVFMVGDGYAGDDLQYRITRLNSQGDIVWSKIYGDTTKMDYAGLLTISSDGYIILLGSTEKYDFEAGSKISKLIKVDLNGEIVWENSYGWVFGSTLRGKPVSLANGEMLFSFEKCDPNMMCGIYTEGAVTKLDAQGHEKWTIDLPKPTIDIGECSVSAINDNLYVGSWIYDTNWRYPPVLYFIDSSSNILSRYIYFNPTKLELSSLATLPNGNLLGVGHGYLTQDIDGGWLFCMDPLQKQVLWERLMIDTTFDGYSPTFYNGIGTSDGGVILSGDLINNMTGVSEVHNWICKLDSKGCLTPNCGFDNFINSTEEVTFLRGVDISLYPNPTHGLLNVEMPAALQNLPNSRVILWSGALKKKEYSGYFNHFNYYDLSIFPAGVYQLVFMVGNEVVAAKQVVKL